ncbi:MAG: gamma-glutamyltransferase [Actinobacteria bacterium]|nr:gamma-glutamyltransferase [Actinomycetota bacterium]
MYLQAGALPYPAGGTLVQTDYADSLALVMREGPRAFYRGRIARLIDAEMTRSQTSPYPGDRALLTYADLATYRPIWRRPLSMRYRDTTILGMPPPSSSVMVMEMLAILEGFDLAGAGHSSPDHVHLVAEAEKLARVDREAYVADPAFEDVPTQTLISRAYAASRRALIDGGRAGDYAPGDIGRAPSQGAPRNIASHTTHVSVVDRWGNAVAVTCSLGPAFGSGVVARGTGFLLASTNHYFSEPGHVNEAEPGKRSATAMAPLMVIRDGVPVLVAGGAGSETIPPGVAQMAVDVVDFRMDLGRAIDVARFHEPACCDLFVEDARIPVATLEELERRGHSIGRLGEYWVLPWIQLAGVDPSTGERLGASDPRGEYGAAAL